MSASSLNWWYNARQLAPDVLLGVREPFLDPRDVEENAARGLPRPAFTSRMMQRATCRASGARVGGARSCRLHITPALFLVVGRLAPVVVRDRIEHEAASFAVEKNAPFTTYAFRDEDAWTLGGQIMPVGWNWMNSMSISSAPA